MFVIIILIYCDDTLQAERTALIIRLGERTNITFHDIIKGDEIGEEILKSVDPKILKKVNIDSPWRRKQQEKELENQRIENARLNEEFFMKMPGNFKPLESSPIRLTQED